jgi:hypothetical protein
VVVHFPQAHGVLHLSRRSPCRRQCRQDRLTGLRADHVALHPVGVEDHPGSADVQHDVPHKPMTAVVQPAASSLLPCGEPSAAFFQDQGEQKLVVP